MTTHYAILRVQRIRTRADADAATRHGQRADSGTHYDADRTHLNRHWRGGKWVGEAVDWWAAIEQAVSDHDIHVRSNGAVAAELFLGASPEFFFCGDSNVNAGRLEIWLEANLRWLETRFPEMLLSARLDLDESTPHLSVLLLPLYQKTTRYEVKCAVSYRRVFCGENKQQTSERMVALQDDYAAAMSPLGLERGIPKQITRREHLSHHQYVSRKTQEDAERRRALAAAARELKETERLRRLAETRLNEAAEMATQSRDRLRWAGRAVQRMADLLPADYHPTGLDEDIRLLARRDRQTQLLATRINALLSQDQEVDPAPMHPG